MNQSMGQMAFEATTQYIATNIPDDISEVSNEWSALPPAYREAWEAGAQAVLTERNRIFNETMAANRPDERASGTGSVFNKRGSGEAEQREARDLPFNLRSMGLHHPLGEER